MTSVDGGSKYLVTSGPLVTIRQIDARNTVGLEPVNLTFSSGKNSSIANAPPVCRWQKVQ
jgi:hypothetical protein